MVLEKDGEDQLDRTCDKCRKVVQRRGNEENNIVRKIKRRKANWIGDVLRRKRFLEHVIEGKVEGM